MARASVVTFEIPSIPRNGPEFGEADSGQEFGRRSPRTRAETEEHDPKLRAWTLVATEDFHLDQNDRRWVNSQQSDGEDEEASDDDAFGSSAYESSPHMGTGESRMGDEEEEFWRRSTSGSREEQFWQPRVSMRMLLEQEALERKQQETIDQLREEQTEREEEWERRFKEMTAECEQLEVARQALEEELHNAEHKIDTLMERLNALTSENDDLRKNIQDIHTDFEERANDSEEMQAQRGKMLVSKLVEKMRVASHRAMRQTLEEKLEVEQNKNAYHEDKHKLRELESACEQLKWERDQFEQQWKTAQADCQVLQDKVEHDESHACKLQQELEKLEFQAEHEAVQRRERRKSRILGIVEDEHESGLSGSEDGSEIAEDMGGSLNLADELSGLGERLSIGRRTSTQTGRLEAELDVARQTISHLRAELAALEEFRDNSEPHLREMTERVQRLEREKQRMEADVAQSHRMAERLGNMERALKDKEGDADRLHHAEMSKLTRCLKSKEQEAASNAERLERALREKESVVERLRHAREEQAASESIAAELRCAEEQVGMRCRKSEEEEEQLLLQLQQEHAECMRFAEGLALFDEEANAVDSAEVQRLEEKCALLQSEANSVDSAEVQRLEEKCALLQKHLGRFMDVECRACTSAFEESQANKELHIRCEHYLSAERSAQELCAEAECQQLHVQSAALLRTENAALSMVQEGLRQTDWLEAACARLEQQSEVAMAAESRVQGAVRASWEKNEAFRQNCEAVQEKVASEKEQLDYTRFWLHNQAGQLHTQVAKFVNSQKLMHKPVLRQMLSRQFLPTSKELGTRKPILFKKAVQSI